MQRDADSRTVSTSNKFSFSDLIRGYPRESAAKLFGGPMPGWLKVLLIVIVVVIVLAVGVVAIAGFLIYRNKDAIVAKTKEIATEAKNFGEQTDNRGCVDESISRYKAEPGFTKAIS